jgi:hypothetical protein
MILALSITYNMCKRSIRFPKKDQKSVSKGGERSHDKRRIEKSNTPAL